MTRIGHGITNNKQIITGLSVVALLCMSVLAQAQNTFQLAPPYLRYGSVFFKKEALVTLDFAQDNTQIHYTANGEEPTEKDPVYRRPIRLKKNAITLKAKVFGAGFLPSETVESTFYSIGLPIESISATLPHERYPGTGNATLIDGLGGIAAYSNKSWMGFQQDTVTLLLTFSKPQKVKNVLLHVLQNQNAWIFRPVKIEAFSLRKGSKEWDLIASKALDPTKKEVRPACQGILINTKLKTKTNQIILKIYPLAQLPEWHPGKGNPAWLFLDEVRVY